MNGKVYKMFYTPKGETGMGCVGRGVLKAKLNYVYYCAEFVFHMAATFGGGGLVLLSSLLHTCDLFIKLGRE